MIQVNGDPLAWSAGMTVRDVIQAKNYRFPLLIVSIDDEQVRKDDYATTTVPDGAVVQVLHLISGG
jgi:sulfur carrier protein